jgi:DNA-binding CsgD family transcriptional regulator
VRSAVERDSEYGTEPALSASAHAADVAGRQGGPRLPTDVLAAALALSLWLASGSVVLAVFDGLGPNPGRRLGIGLFFVVVTAVALWRRAALSVALVARPWLVVPIAVGQLAAAAVDGVVGGPYGAFSLTSIGLAVVVARARTVWICVLLLVLGYLAAALSQHSLDEMADDHQLGSVIGAVVSYPVAALLLMGLRRRFTRFLDRIDATLDAIRQGEPAFTPALSRALGPVTAALPPAPVTLTRTEQRVVDALVGGSAPKQIARELSVSIATVRTHIKHAKRKLGASTLPELAAIAARRQRGAEDDDER